MAISVPVALTSLATLFLTSIYVNDSIDCLFQAISCPLFSISEDMRSKQILGPIFSSLISSYRKKFEIIKTILTYVFNRVNSHLRNVPVKPGGTIGLRSVRPSVCLSVSQSMHPTKKCGTQFLKNYQFYLYVLYNTNIVGYYACLFSVSSYIFRMAAILLGGYRLSKTVIRLTSFVSSAVLLLMDIIII